MPDKKPIVGILALQGDFEAHRKMLEERLGAETCLVRTSEEVKQVDGLILPGGESTTVGKLMDRYGLDEAIRERAAEGMPVYGTCAGLILLAKEIEGSDQLRLGLMDVTVARNAFGRQVDSFEADIPVPVIGEDPVRGVFIRAPYVSASDSQVEVLGRFEDKVVAVRQGNLLGSAFHPELTDDSRMHAYFLKMVRDPSQSET
jgi:pyridoxal 5''-phosphate synthase, glutaminase subunit Pdx2